jgi:hypothetical protein
MQFDSGLGIFVFESFRCFDPGIFRGQGWPILRGPSPSQLVRKRDKRDSQEENSQQGHDNHEQTYSLSNRLHREGCILKAANVRDRCHHAIERIRCGKIEKA